MRGMFWSKSPTPWPPAYSQILVQTSRPDQARSLLQAQIQAAHYYELYLKRDPTHLEARAQFADALYHLKRVPEAMAQWQRMGHISSTQALTRFQQAQEDWRLGRAEPALAQLEQAHQLDPWNQDVVLMLAQVRKIHGNTPAGIELLENYLSWNPDRAVAVGYLSQLHARQKNLERAGLLETRFHALTGNIWTSPPDAGLKPESGGTSNAL
jgi:tetratricopeptide (TPR) repeat protein